MTGTAAPAVSARPAPSRMTLMIVGAAGTLAGIALVVALTWMQGEAPVQTASAAAPTPASATKPTAAPVIEESAPAPTWTGQRQATWAQDGSRTIAFELQATHDVPVWMSRARPALVVRCLSRSMQAFVALGTSARFEEDSLHRTIRLQWDDGPMMEQRWQSSESSHELFAPDGAAFVGQLTKTNRLRFGFTPYNAQPVTVDFAVAGFDKLAGLVASTCGRRLPSS